jgi:hypothetical protein
MDVSKGTVAYFVYDLEFIGDINQLSSCKIWDFSIACVETRETFNAIIEPDKTLCEIPEPVVDGLFPLTRAFLTAKRATGFKPAWERIVRWVNARCGTNPVVLISHNNFLSDKPILENHLIQYSTHVPSSWGFYDSLHYFRDNYKTYDYSLKGLVNSILYKTHDNAHRARADTNMLMACLDTFTDGQWCLNGFAYPLFVNSLRRLRGVGQAVEAYLFTHGFIHEEQLLSRAKIFIHDDILSNRPMDKSLNTFLTHFFINANVPISTVQSISNSILNNFKSTQFVNNIFY